MVYRSTFVIIVGSIFGPNGDESFTAVVVSDWEAASDGVSKASSGKRQKVKENGSTMAASLLYSIQSPTFPMWIAYQQSWIGN